MIKLKNKKEIIVQHQSHETDTGSSGVQIALLTKNIQKLISHLKKHPKDQHSRYGLLKMVVKRKRLLKYLGKKEPQRYKEIIKKMELKS